MIPFLDLKAQHAAIKAEIDAAVAAVLESSQFVLGPAVERFEAAFADYCGCRHAVAVNSGTSALHLALIAAGVGPGDEVITTAMTFVATIAAITYVGARPILVDVDPATRNIDPTRIAAAVTTRTKAIIPVHLHGMTADMDSITEIARAHDLVVIEDAAQSHGAEYKGKRAGAMGQYGCFSFYPGKNLGAYGEAGAVVTNDREQAQTLRMLRDWGQERKYVHAMRGFNYRMDGIQGAVLGVKLRHIEAWTEARRSRAAAYGRRLAGSPVILPSEPPQFRHVFHVYAVEVASRDAVQEDLTQAGIATGIHYPIPVHLQPAYRDLGYRDGDLPITERLGRRFLSLPIYPELTDAQIDVVAETLLGACAMQSDDGRR